MDLGDFAVNHNFDRALDVNREVAERKVGDLFVVEILELNKALRTQEQKSDWGRHIAEIPNVLYVTWLDEEHAKGNTDLRLFTPEFDAIVKKKLYDPDYAHLRTDMKNSTIGFMRKQAQWSWSGNT